MDLSLKSIHHVFIENVKSTFEEKTTTYMNTNTDFMETFNKQLLEQFFKPKDYQELQNPEIKLVVG